MADPYGHRFDEMSLDEIVAAALVTEDWGEVIQLAFAAGRKGGDAVMRHARELGESPDARRRQLAAELAGKLTSEAHGDEAEQVLAGLLEDHDVRVMASAIGGLGNLGRYSLPRYVEVGRDHRDFVVRWARLMALESCALGRDFQRPEPDTAAIGGLIELARDPSAGPLSESAVFSLAMIAGFGLETDDLMAELRRQAADGTPEARETARVGLDEWRGNVRDAFRDRFSKGRDEQSQP